MKVDFIIIGAARSATTSLSSLLASHPSISFSKPKEPQFFSKNNWRKNIKNYHMLFKKSKNVLYGEGSTNYSKFPFYNNSIYQDILEYNPKMKFIYIIRNPIDRIVSHYKFALDRGFTKDDINTEVLSKPIYLDTSKYFFQISGYLNLFKKDQIKIVFFEDFKENPQKVCNSLFEFLNIPSNTILTNNTHLNSRSLQS